MELRYVSTFVVLAEELHFGRTASRLHLSVPALSQRIKALEKQLGVTLFERDRRHVELTDAGEVFLVRARSLLEATEAAVAEARNHAGQASGHLRVGIFVNNAAELTVPILQRFRAANPNVKVSFVPLDFAEQISGLTDHRVDVAFVRPPFAESTVAVHTLAYEPRAVLMSHVHSLAEADALSADEVIAESFISAAALGMPQDWTDFWLLANARDAEDRGPSQVRLDNFEAVLFDIAVNGNITTVPYSLARNLQDSSVRGVPLTGFECEIAVASRPDEHDSLVERFCEIAEKTSRDLISLVPGGRLAG